MSELTPEAKPSPESWESALAALRPAPSRLATERALRDRLMYEAGVASVRLPAGSESLRALKLPARGRSVWNYSLASAAAAAISAVILTRSVMAPQLAEVAKPTDTPSKAAEEVIELAQHSVHVVEMQAETQAETQTESPAEAKFVATEQPDPGAYAAGSPWGIFSFPQGALMAQRNRVLLEEEFRFRDLRGAADGFTEVSYTPPKTARELRAEYLPPRTERSATPSAWHWLTNWTQRGEEI